MTDLADVTIGVTRILVDLDVDFISLVKKPATGKPLILKGAAQVKTFEVKASADEMHRAYGVVYAPGEIDSHGDTTTPEVIFKAAAAFMQKKRLNNIDIEHSFAPTQAFVAESWIIRSGDPLFPMEQPGGWAVGIQVQDETLWQALKEGQLTGLSLAGTAATHVVEKQEISAMSEEDVRRIASEIVQQAIEEALRVVKPAAQEEPPPTDKPTTPPPMAKSESVSKSDLDQLKSEISQVLKEELARSLQRGAAETSSAPTFEKTIWGLV